MNVQGMNVSMVTSQLKTSNIVATKAPAAELETQSATEEQNESAVVQASEGEKGSIVNTYA